MTNTVERIRSPNRLVLRRIFRGYQRPALTPALLDWDEAHNGGHHEQEGHWSEECPTEVFEARKVVPPRVFRIVIDDNLVADLWPLAARRLAQASVEPTSHVKTIRVAVVVI